MTEDEQAQAVMVALAGQPVCRSCKQPLTRVYMTNDERIVTWICKTYWCGRYQPPLFETFR